MTNKTTAEVRTIHPQRSHDSSRLLNFAGMLMPFLFAILALTTPPALAQNVFDEVLVQSIDIDPEPPGFSSAESKYGSTVAMHDGRLIMAGTGSPIFVFHKVDDSWEELQVLFLPAGASLPSVSRPLALAVFGDFLMIGDPNAALNDQAVRSGMIYFAEWTGAEYQVRASLSPPVRRSQMEFGARIAVNSNSLFVGAPGAVDGEGRVFAYDIPDKVADISQQTPFVTLAPPSASGGAYGASLDASDAWLVVKQRASADAIPDSAVAYGLSPPSFDSPLIIDLDANSLESRGSDIHVRDDVVLVRRKQISSSFQPRSDYLQFRLLGDTVEELPRLADNSPARGFLPALAEAGDLLYLISVFDDPNSGSPSPQIFTAVWSGSSWTLDPIPADGPSDLLAFDDLSEISSAAADSSTFGLGNPGFRPGGSAGGGLGVITLSSPGELAQVLDAGRDGLARRLGQSLARTESSLIVGAPGWCKVYVLDATPPAFSLKQTLTTSPPCAFGADIVADGEMLYVGNRLWEPSTGLFRPEEGQVHVFRLESDSYVEQEPIRVLPHIGSRMLGSRLAMDSGRLFIAGSEEVFMFENAQIPVGPAASAQFGTIVARNAMNLAVNHGVVAVSVSGRLGGFVSIFDTALNAEQTISDLATDFGLGLDVLGPTKFATTRLGAVASYEFAAGNWSLSDELAPDPPILRFGSAISIEQDQGLIGTASGLVTTISEDGEMNLDIVVPAVEPDLFTPVSEIAHGPTPSSAFLGFPLQDVSRIKTDLLLFIEFDAVIKRDGFESQLP